MTSSPALKSVDKEIKPSSSVQNLGISANKDDLDHKQEVSTNKDDISPKMSLPKQETPINKDNKIVEDPLPKQETPTDSSFNKKQVNSNYNNKFQIQIDCFSLLYLLKMQRI